MCRSRVPRAFTALLGLLALLLCASPGRALAADAPSEARRAEAREHFQKGSGYQQQRDFARAIEEYQQAFALVPLPELLFNIAQCYRLAGDHVNAVVYYRRYIDEDPSGRAVTEALLHIDELTRPVEPAPAPVAPAPPRAPPAPAVVVPAPSPVRLRVTGSRGLRIAGVATFSTGVAALGVGVWFAADVRRLEQDIERTPRWGKDYEAKLAAGDRAQTRMIVAFAAGGALVLGGAALYWFGREHHEQVAVTPLVGALNGVGLVGRF